MHRQGQGTPTLQVCVKVSVATTLHRSRGGQFAHVASLPGNPYDGHTLVKVIRGIEMLVGKYHHRSRLSRPQRAAEYKFKVFTAGQKRRSQGANCVATI